MPAIMEDPAATQRLAHLVALNAEIESLKAQAAADRIEVYKIARQLGDKQLRVELLCQAVGKLIEIIQLQAGLDFEALTEHGREVATVSRDLAVELLKP
jgi:hypothetical protein